MQTNGPKAEGALKVRRFEKLPVTLDDGTIITLRKPIFTVENPLYSTQDLTFSPRKPPATIGMGLLEAVPDSTIDCGGRAYQGNTTSGDVQKLVTIRQYYGSESANLTLISAPCSILPKSWNDRVGPQAVPISPDNRQPIFAGIRPPTTPGWIP